MKKLAKWLNKSSEFVYDDNGDRAYAPHCDPSVLHAPGECEYCDHYEDWQNYRITARINFSGHSNPDLAPCPSVAFRPEEVIDRWGGNRANPSDECVQERYEAIRRERELP